MKTHSYFIQCTACVHGIPSAGARRNAHLAVRAFANYKLAFATDVEELPDTPEQRYLEHLGACLEGSMWFGAMTAEQALKAGPCDDSVSWLIGELEDDLGEDVDECDLYAVLDAFQRGMNRLEWSGRGARR